MKWIKCSESLPIKYEVYLVYCINKEFINEGPYFIAKYYGNAEWIICNDTYPNSSNYIGFNPTDWMPLPKPPEMEWLPLN